MLFGWLVDSNMRLISLVKYAWSQFLRDKVSSRSSPEIPVDQSVALVSLLLGIKSGASADLVLFMADAKSFDAHEIRGPKESAGFSAVLARVGHDGRGGVSSFSSYSSPEP